ncbi:dihydroxy-acid dehydratase [Luteolibacter sp. GHJ8]|uniref:Dihydroxy-acid dehydratase n=1 Tax=Luteolibacter rhizosphaerae TaxID=2989719 RepID=A0ABT3G1P7_9BACT|nr:dihydroxy-acid dehydratase [Luteolibacter rhizosphaerae]MCW1913762.1 dihydroxy-acid dehydratase [Luteolibacter rhizosphaerae]
MSDPSRPYSSLMLDGPDRAPSRAMLYAVGFQKEDFSKPHIGIASTWSQVTPCNIHIDRLAKESAKGADAAGGKAVIFNTITISDGISMGTEGMKYSLVSREVIADSIETVVGCEGMDGFVAIGGCDKNMPACVMAMARMNRPSVFVYGGTILPGCATIKGELKDLDIVSVFEAVGKHASGEYSDEELETVEACAIPGEGSCGGMYTANTMASAIEALGMSLPNSSAQAAVSEDKMRDCFDAGAAVLNMINLGIKPRDIMTRKAFENAITVVIALGGSTNAVLHLLAMAHAAEVELSINDFTEIGKRVPLLADLKPSGKYSMAALVKIGGTVPLLRILLEAGLLHGDCLTVTGKTLAENLANSKIFYPAGQDIIRPLDNPIKKDSHLRILYGNLAPGGAVAKITGKEGELFTGPARVFDSEDEAMKAILDGKIVDGDVIVIRREGPKGGPGMREMLGPTSAIMGRGLGKTVALITDGRFSGGSHGFVVGHITPEAHDGGPIGLLVEGDIITIDAKNNLISVDLDDEALKARRENWTQPAPRYTRGVLAKYAKLTTSASEGGVTDKYL